MKEILIEVEGLSKNFGNIPAVKCANFSVRAGCITAFLGENGAGKTTTIKMILNFLEKDSGSVKLNTKSVGYVSEHPVFFSWLRGEEILRYTSRLYGIPGKSLESLVTNYSLKLSFDPGLLSRKVQTYSLGNQKKFFYLQSLILSPELLIVDEPFSSLDPFSIKSARDLFLDFKKKGKAVFLSTHLISEVEKIVDEFIILKKGSVVIQENFQRMKEAFAFIRLKKEGTKKELFLPLAAWIKEEGSFLEMLISKDKIDLVENLLDGEEESVARTLDLETIFIFFAESFYTTRGLQALPSKPQMF